MNSKDNIKKSLYDEIIEEMFNKLKNIDVFNEINISKLKELSNKSQLSSVEKVFESIKYEVGEENENIRT